MIRPLLELTAFGPLLIVIKVSMVLAGGFLLAYTLRGVSASVRHFVWVVTLCGAMAVPAITRISPRLEWAVLSEVPAPINSSLTPIDIALPEAPEQSPAFQAVSVSPESAGLHVPKLSLFSVWLAGAVLVTLWVAVGHLMLLRMARCARPLRDPSWLEVLKETSLASGVSRPVSLLSSTEIDSPMTWGWLSPIILLPNAADTWTPERRRVVLLHELAHVTRFDFVSQLLAALACAMYWFHPAVWGAARRLRQESERACDDHALVSGTPAVEYASHLLSLALQSNTHRWHEAMATGLTRSSTLEMRVRAVLDEGLERQALSQRVRILGSMLLGVLVFTLSALTPVKAAFNETLTFEAAPAEVAEPQEDPVVAATPPANCTPVVPATPEAVVTASSTYTKERTETVVSRSIDAEPGERLDLRLDAGGNVDIQGWDKPEVKILARITGPDADKIKVDVDRTSDGVQVKAYFAEHSRVETSSNDFEVHVPRKFDLQLHSSGGGLHMSNVEGTFEGNTGGGEIVLENVKGHASLSTGGSDIRVTDSHLDGDVSTGGGTVNFIGVKGGLVGSSGSGPVMYHDSMKEAELDKLSEKLADLGDHMQTLMGTEVQVAEEAAAHAVEISNSGGDVRLDEIPRGATIEIGGGDVVIGKTGGVVELTTGGGDIEIGPVQGSLTASTGGGDIKVRVGKPQDEAQTIDLTSGSGKVILELPSSFDGTIELETSYTRSFGRESRIESDWTLARESTREWDGSRGTPRRFVRAHAKLGEGQSYVRVSTVNGDIVLRRAKQ